MNSRICKACGSVLILVVAGHFYVCGFCGDRYECGHPDLPSQPGDFSTFQPNFSSSASSVTVASSFTSQFYDES